MHVLVNILPLPRLQSDSAGWTAASETRGASVLLRVHTVVGGQNREEIPEDPHAHLSQNPRECEAHGGVLPYTGHM